MLAMHDVIDDSLLKSRGITVDIGYAARETKPDWLLVRHNMLHVTSYMSAKCNTSVCNDKYRRPETDTDSTLATEASLKLPWSLAKQCWQTSLAAKRTTASTLVSAGACPCMKFE